MGDQFGTTILGGIQLLVGVRCVSCLHLTVPLLHIPGKHWAGSQQEEDTDFHEAQFSAFTVKEMNK